MFQRVLVGWDGSRVAKRALDTAVDLARRYDAEIIAVSVAHSPAHAETEADRVESVEAARSRLVDSFATAGDAARRVGVDLEHVVIEGDHPADDLIGYAHEHAFDLVVVGHHRRRGSGRFVVHGLTERLIDVCDVPVLVVTEANGD